MQFFLTLSALAAATYAAAVPEQYTLSTKSSVNTLNGLYLSAKNGKIGAFAGARDNAGQAGKFFTSTYVPTQTLSIHTGDASHQVALQLANTGFLQLVDLVNPSDVTTRGKPTEWSVFTIGADGTVGVKDGAVIPSRQWAAYLDTDGQYYVGLWDGFTKQPRSLANITIVATKADADKRY